MHHRLTTTLIAAAWLALLPACSSGGAQPAEPARHATHHAAPAGDTAAELAAQIERVRAATERYKDHDLAVADGFELFGSEGPLMGEHWYRKDLVREPFDVERPSTLQYAVIDGERVLVGVAYTVYLRRGEPVPAGFAGGEDVWHVHDVERMAMAMAADRPRLRRIVEQRRAQGRLGAGDGRTRLAMVHAWIWLDNPDGMFADYHRALPYLRAGLPVSRVETGDLDAAWGAALLEEGACRREIGRIHLIANLSREQMETLGRACVTAAARVRGALRSGQGAVALNRAAAEAWRAFEATRDETLTAEQRERLGAVMEHPAGHVPGLDHGQHDHLHPPHRH